MQIQPRDEFERAAFAHLESLGRLRPGWDSYRAPVPSQSATANARAFLMVLLDAGLPPPMIDASVVGGIAITLRQGSRKGVVEFYNDGAAVLLLADDATEELSTRDLSTTPAAFAEAARQIHAYVKD